jgi:hypothetical protein
LIRVSTSLFRPAQGVDGRVEPGQDEIGKEYRSYGRRKDFPRTALRRTGNLADYAPKTAILLGKGVRQNQTLAGELPSQGNREFATAEPGIKFAEPGIFA